MKIAFVGRVTLSLLEQRFQFNSLFPEVKWGFPLGSEIVMELVRRGHEVHVITEDSSIGENGLRFESVGLNEEVEENIGKLVVHLVPSRKRSRWTFLTLFSKEVRGMRNVIREINPDVVFAQWTYYNAYAGLTSGYPTLVVAHDSPWRVVKCQPNVMTIIKALYSQIFVFPRLKSLTTVSPYIVGELRRFNRYKREIAVIPNGINIQKGVVDVGSNVDSVRTIVCVSQWGRLKNVKVLLKAFVELHKKYKDWHLILVGSWLEKDRGAGEWMRKNSLSLEGIEFMGQKRCDEVVRILRNKVDIFCSPSLEESFGMVFIEAMINGVPCVGGQRSGAVPWVIGDAGVTCDVRDPMELAKCIELLMLDSERRRIMGKNGILRVKEMFSLEKTVDLYEEMLLRVVKENK